MSLNSLISIFKEISLEVKEFLNHEIKKLSFPLENLKEIEVHLHQKTDKLVFDKLKETGLSFLILNDKSTFSGPICEMIKVGNEKPQYIIMVDSIDGSMNLVRGNWNYSFALALAKYKEESYFSDIVYSLVVNLITGDEIQAIKGKGTFLNGKRVYSRKCDDVKGITLGIDLNYRGENKESFLKTIKILLNNLIGKNVTIQFLGTNSLQASMISYGALDAFIDVRDCANVPDIAPAYLIVKEAGGEVLQKRGEPFANVKLLPSKDYSVIYAATPKLAKKIINLIGEI